VGRGTGGEGLACGGGEVGEGGDLVLEEGEDAEAGWGAAYRLS
jgi:hypothetical protein